MNLIQYIQVVELKTCFLFLESQSIRTSCLRNLTFFRSGFKVGFSQVSKRIPKYKPLHKEKPFKTSYKKPTTFIASDKRVIIHNKAQACSPVVLVRCREPGADLKNPPVGYCNLISPEGLFKFETLAQGWRTNGMRCNILGMSLTDYKNAPVVVYSLQSITQRFTFFCSKHLIKEF